MVVWQHSGTVVYRHADLLRSGCSMATQGFISAQSVLANGFVIRGMLQHGAKALILCAVTSANVWLVLRQLLG